jgi:hypothetical protein
MQRPCQAVQTRTERQVRVTEGAAHQMGGVRGHVAALQAQTRFEVMNKSNQ